MSIAKKINLEFTTYDFIEATYLYDKEINVSG